MEKNSFLIILGTAHLGTTPGKCSPDGKLKEAVYSRELVSDIEAILKDLGYNVIVDYRELTGISNDQELSYRVGKVNKLCQTWGKDNVIYVSIHVNAAGNSGWSTAGGWSAYTSIGQTKSDILAECLYEAAEDNLGEYEKIMSAGKEAGNYGKSQKHIRKDLTDGDSDLEENFYVLYNTLCPAVLTENLFQDNRRDVEYLLSDLGRHNLSRLHVEGIIRYYDKFSTHTGGNV